LAQNNVGSSWPSYIDLIQLSCRSAVSSNRPLSAFHVCYGFCPPVFLPEAEIGTPTEDTLGAPIRASSNREYVEKMFQRWEIVRQLHAQNVLLDQADMKQRYDKKIREYRPGYEEGQMVWLREEVCRANSCARFKFTYRGPYVIVQKLNDRHVMLNDAKTNECVKNKVHIDRLKPYLKPIDESEEKTEKAEKPQKDCLEKKGIEGKNLKKEKLEEAKDKEDAYFPAKRIIKQKNTGVSRQFLVEFVPVGNEPAEKCWVKHDNVSDALQDHFYATHTLSGKLRKRKTPNS